MTQNLMYDTRMESKDALTTADAARELGISVRALQHRLKTGMLRGDNLGGRLWLIPREEVERAKAAGRLKPGPKPKRQRANDQEQTP